MLIENRNLGYGLALNENPTFINYVDCGNVANYGSESYSISCSFLVRNLANVPFLFSKGLFPNGGNYLTLYPNGSVGWFFFSGTSGYFGLFSVNNTIPLNQIVNVVLIKNGNFCSMFVDGEPITLIRQDSVAGTIPVALNFIIGKHYQPSYQFNGIFYDFKIFDKVLNQIEAEEMNIYNNIPLTANSNVVMHLGFNGVTGTTIRDKSSNGNNGTLIGYNAGDKPFRDIQNSIVNNYVI